jgi:nucleoid-associated protein YgaU
MSVATDFPPEVFVRERASGGRRRLSLVTTLPDDEAWPSSPFAAGSAPAAGSPATAGCIALASAPHPGPAVRPRDHIRPVAAPVHLSATRRSALPTPLTSRVRLTRRGLIASALAVALSSAALLALAWQSAPPAPPSPARSPARVTVHTGDTLWSVARQVAPNRDPRDVVDDLRRVNHLAGVDVTPGQLLRTR